MAKAKRKKPRPGRPLPEVQAALVCDNVIQAQDGKHTVVSIYDTLTVRSPTETMLPGIAEFVVFVGLKAGDARGRRTVKILGMNPDGNKEFEHQSDITFGKNPSGHMITMRARLFVSKAGLYWFHIIVDGQQLTRIPLLIRFERQIEKQDSAAEAKKRKSPKRKPLKKK